MTKLIIKSAAIPLTLLPEYTSYAHQLPAPSESLLKRALTLAFFNQLCRRISLRQLLMEMVDPPPFIQADRLPK